MDNFHKNAVQIMLHYFIFPSPAKRGGKSVLIILRSVGEKRFDFSTPRGKKSVSNPVHPI